MGQNRLREEGKLRQMAPKSFVLYCHSSNLYCSSFKLCCPPTLPIIRHQLTKQHDNLCPLAYSFQN